MTTLTTTTSPQFNLKKAAFTIAFGVILGAAAVIGISRWQSDEGSSAVGESAPAVSTSAGEAATSRGGLGELFTEQQAARSAAETATADTRGGLAELYGQQQADRVAEEAARLSALGGADAPYRTNPPAPTCGDSEGEFSC